jgi:TRAP-type C4-dicarboxylate transport system permease small subunit
LPPLADEHGAMIWVARLRRATLTYLKHCIAALLLMAICVMGVGVVLRYIVLPITLALNADPISFFWVEEVGEFILAWIAMIGAALGISERTHFFLAVFTQYLPAKVQFAVHAVSQVLIAVFGGFLAWQGWIIIGLNQGLRTPALEMNLSWLFSSLVAGGLLIIFFALAVIARGPMDHQHIVE